MEIKEVRAMTHDQILARLNDAQEELMRLRFQQATGELTNTSRVPQVRRDIARLLTVLNERQAEADNTEGVK